MWWGEGKAAILIHQDDLRIVDGFASIKQCTKALDVVQPDLLITIQFGIMLQEKRLIVQINSRGSVDSYK